MVIMSRFPLKLSDSRRKYNRPLRSAPIERFDCSVRKILRILRLVIDATEFGWAFTIYNFRTLPKCAVYQKDSWVKITTTHRTRWQIRNREHSKHLTRSDLFCQHLTNFAGGDWHDSIWAIIHNLKSHQAPSWCTIKYRAWVKIEHKILTYKILELIASLMQNPWSSSHVRLFKGILRRGIKTVEIWSASSVLNSVVSCEGEISNHLDQTMNQGKNRENEFAWSDIVNCGGYYKHTEFLWPEISGATEPARTYLLCHVNRFKYLSKWKSYSSTPSRSFS